MLVREIVTLQLKMSITFESDSWTSKLTAFWIVSISFSDKDRVFLFTNKYGPFWRSARSNWLKEQNMKLPTHLHLRIDSTVAYGRVVCSNLQLKGNCS
jgi:hypothetical protein